MKHSRRFINCRAAAFSALAISATLRADDVAATEEGPPVDAGNAVRFTVPAAIRGPARYQVSVQFAGEREQSVSLYVWAADSNDIGHWQRRLFYNNYWQGSTVTGTMFLESGRSYALLAHLKPAPSPGFGTQWVQMKTLTTELPAGTTDAAPSVRASFPQSTDVTTVVTFQPVAAVAAADK